VFWKKRRPAPDIFTDPLVRCSFCNKSAREVVKMVSGPRVNICCECVAICQDVLANNRRLGLAPEPSLEAIQRAEDLVSGKEAIRCALCSAVRPLTESVLVPLRGWLCKPCVSAAADAATGRS
jgi:hypothetical protein